MYGTKVMTQMMEPNTDLCRCQADPAVKKRLVKLKFRTRLEEGLKLEEGLNTAGSILLVFSVVGILCGAFGFQNPRTQRIHDPDPAVVRYATGALLVSLILLAARFCFRNCYLVDPRRGCLIWHYQFLWLRRIRVVLQRWEIAGVATQGEKFERRHGSWWGYRVVVEAIAGADIPVSNWRPNGRDKCKAEADKLAKLLGCRSSIALPEFTP